MAAVSRTAHIFTGSIIYMYDVCCAGTTLATKRIKQPAGIDVPECEALHEKSIKHIFCIYVTHRNGQDFTLDRRKK